MPKRILIYDTAVSEMLSGRTFGGIAVQLYFWAQVFEANGWEVHLLSYEPNIHTKDGITFHPVRNTRGLNLLYEFLDAQQICRCVHPDIVMIRGAQRKTFALARSAHSVGAKLVFFGASDVNFDLKRASVGNGVNRWLYGRGLHKVDRFVCQNLFQHDTLLKNFNRESIVMFNIWGNYSGSAVDSVKTYDAVWISNFRSLKRPHWVLNLALRFPDKRFAMAGGQFGPLFDQIKAETEAIENLDFLGPVSLDVSNHLAQTAKVLLCTSEYEGFPNTFLQAWSAGVPVITTVNPSGIIDLNRLGMVVADEAGLANAFDKMMTTPSLQASFHKSIKKFFAYNMAPQQAYDKLIEYVNIS